MGLFRRMLLAALAEVGKPKREAPQDRTEMLVGRFADAMGLSHDEAWKKVLSGERDLDEILGRPGSLLRVVDLPVETVSINDRQPEYDVTTPEGRRALFESEFAKHSEKLRTRN